MSTYERVANLLIAVEGYALEELSRTVSSGFERVTTVVHLHGGGEEGLGEDVTYDADDQRAQLAHGPALDLAFEGTLDGFAERLASLDLFPARPPAFEVYRHYR